MESWQRSEMETGTNGNRQLSFVEFEHLVGGLNGRRMVLNKMAEDMFIIYTYYIVGIIPYPPANFLCKILEHVLQIDLFFITPFSCLGNWFSDSIEF